MSKFTNAIERFQRGFFDRPARIPSDAETAYWKAVRTTSISGDCCKFLGLLGALIFTPMAIIYASTASSPMAGFPLAGGIFVTSLVTAAIGSSASSNKRTAALLALQLWENGPS